MLLRILKGNNFRTMALVTAITEIYEGPSLVSNDMTLCLRCAQETITSICSMLRERQTFFGIQDFIIFDDNLQTVFEPARVRYCIELRVWGS